MAREGSGSRWSVWGEAGLAVAAGLAAMSFLVCEVYDLDVFWNVTIGRDILVRHAVPLVDRYTAAGFGHPYQDIHWLFQVLAALAHHAAGWTGVELLTMTVWAAGLVACFTAARRWVSVAPAAVLTFAVAMASAERFLSRPEIITFLMVLFFYLRLQDGKVRTWWQVTLLAGCEVVWANSHGLFVIGPFMVGCYLLEHLWLRRQGRPHAATSLVRLLVLLVAVSCFTPFGWRSWSYAWLLVTQVSPGAPEVLRSLGELSPTFGAAARSAPAFWFFAALLGGSLVAAVSGVLRRRLSPARAMIVAGMAMAACTGRRNVVLLALVAAPFIAEHLGWLRVPRRGRVAATISAAAVMLASSWYALSGRYYLGMEIPARFGLGVTPSFFPHGLPPFMDRIGFKGQIYNSNTIGGFLMFHGFPDRLPLSEGRWTAYDGETIERVLAAAHNPALWRWIVDTYAVQGVVLAHTSPEARGLLPRLAADPGWRLVYLDYAASFWLSAHVHVDAPTIDPEVPLPSPPSRIDDCIILNAFYELVGTTRSRIVNLERASTFAWKREAHLERLGSLQLEHDLLEDAETTFRRLADLFPRNVAALNELAYLAYLRGDRVAARRLLLRAIEIAPRDPQLRANLERLDRH